MKKWVQSMVAAAFIKVLEMAGLDCEPIIGDDRRREAKGQILSTAP